MNLEYYTMAASFRAAGCALICIYLCLEQLNVFSLVIFKLCCSYKRLCFNFLRFFFLDFNEINHRKLNFFVVRYDILMFLFLFEFSNRSLKLAHIICSKTAIFHVNIETLMMIIRFPVDTICFGMFVVPQKRPNNGDLCGKPARPFKNPDAYSFLGIFTLI